VLSCAVQEITTRKNLYMFIKGTIFSGFFKIILIHGLLNTWNPQIQRVNCKEFSNYKKKIK
jgi:hypothetical protein